jgi:PAS domain S-box-containing protein
MDGKVLEANRQAVNISGYSLADLKEHIYLCACSEPEKKFLLTSVPPDGDTALENTQVMTYESSLITENGEVIPVLVNARPLKIDGVSQIQWIIRDISEIKKLRQYQEDSVAMIYHDLRTPIANIISAVDILHSMHLEYNNPGVTSLVNILSRSIDRMQRLTSNLLDVKYLEAGQALVKRKQTPIPEIIMDAVQNIQLGAESKGQKLEIDIAPVLPELFVDADMIKRVLINLLENASKFTPKGGIIRVDAKQADGNVLFSVKDTGPGIPTDAMQKIFEKFVTFSPETHSRSLGIGLAFCRLAVEAHGGKIWAESDPGKGSAFQFILPVALNQQDP